MFRADRSIISRRDPGLCGSKYLIVCDTIDLLNEHIRRNHFDFVCEECRGSFASTDVLAQHKLHYHPKYGCHQCSELSLRGDELDRHVASTHAARTTSDESARDQAETVRKLAEQVEILRALTENLSREVATLTRFCEQHLGDQETRRWELQQAHEARLEELRHAHVVRVRDLQRAHEERLLELEEGGQDL